MDFLMHYNAVFTLVMQNGQQFITEYYNFFFQGIYNGIVDYESIFAYSFSFTWIIRIFFFLNFHWFKSYDTNIIFDFFKFKLVQVWIICFYFILLFIILFIDYYSQNIEIFILKKIQIKMIIDRLLDMQVMGK